MTRRLLSLRLHDAVDGMLADIAQEKRQRAQQAWKHGAMFALMKIEDGHTVAEVWEMFDKEIRKHAKEEDT